MFNDIAWAMAPAQGQGGRGRRINNHVLSSVNISFVVFYFLLIEAAAERRLRNISGCLKA